MNLRQYRVNELGWSVSKLASEAGITRPAVSAAEDGKPIQAATAKAIAGALSRALKRQIKPLEIEGLNIL